jgi:hypothetical protein
MQVGSFGPLVFCSSASDVFTPVDLRRRRVAQFAEHPVVDGLARLQHLGTSLAEVSFKVQLDHTFTDVETKLIEIDALLESGEHHALVIAGRRLGRFVLTESNEVAKKMSASKVLWAEVELKLKEYN